MVKRASVAKTKAKPSKKSKPAPNPKRKAKSKVVASASRKVTASTSKKRVASITPKQKSQGWDLPAALGSIEGAIVEMRSQISSFETAVMAQVQKLEWDRKALEDRLNALVAEAVSPLKEQLIVPLQHELSRRLDGFAHQLTELSRSIEPGRR